MRDLKDHFRNVDITRKQVSVEKVSDEFLKKYETVTEEKTSRCTKKYQEKSLSHAFKTERPDIHFQKNIIKNHFKCK